MILCFIIFLRGFNYMIKYYDYDESDAYLEWINDQVYKWVKFVLEEFEVNNDCYENQYEWIENFFS